MTFFEERVKELAVTSKSATAPFPRNCLIEVTNACNHACVFCHNPFMHRVAGTLSKDVFARFVAEAQPLGLREVGLYSTGEPFLVKQLDWYVAAAKAAGISRVYVTTNGAMASLERVKSAVAAGLDSIKFSINAATRESYKLVHGRDEFELVLENVRAIHEWRTLENIKLQMLGSFVYTTGTKSEIQSHRLLFSTYFEDIIYMQAQSQGGRTEGNIASIVEERRYVDPMDVAPCEMLWNRLHLTCEGYLTACCVDYEHDLTYANYAEGVMLTEAWNGPLMQELRQRHIEKRLDKLICKNCLLGGRDEYEPISGIRGRFGRKGKYQDETIDRIHAVEQQAKAAPNAGEQST